MKQLIGLVALVYVFTAAGNASQNPAAKPKTALPGEKPASEGAPFIGTAAMDSLAEVELGRLAAQRASSADVKRFAQKMATEHSKALDELKAMASQKNVVLATELDRQHREFRDKLATLEGAAFDSAYMDQMATAHLKSVALFQQEAREGQDHDIKKWAARTLPMLQEHLKAASSLKAAGSRTGR